MIKKYRSLIAVIVILTSFLSGCKKQVQEDSGERPVYIPEVISDTILEGYVDYDRKNYKYKHEVHLFQLESKTVGEQYVSVVLPKEYNETTKKYPLVIVFGGYGECTKPPQYGARAWIEYYEMDKAITHIENNHLTKDDFLGLIREPYLQYINNQLKHRPYEGLIIVNPHYDCSLDITFSDDYQHYLTKELISFLNASFRIGKNQYGIDGVSHGGTVSMFYALNYPELFISKGAIQGAFSEWMTEFELLVAENGQKLRSAGMPPFQLLTSEKDYLQEFTLKMGKILHQNNIPYIPSEIFPGPHDYEFNRGPGSLMLLYYHSFFLNHMFHH